jgi:signal transduction histidine kinase
MVAFAALPILAFSAMLFLHYAESQREIAENGLTISAKGVARAIDAEIATAVTTLNVLKHSPALEDGDVVAFQHRLEGITAETGRGVALLDAQGREVASTVAAPRAPLTGDEIRHLLTTISERSPYVSDVLIDGASHEAFAYVGVPVRRGNALQWVLATFLYSSDFAEVVSDPGVPEDWIVSIVDRHGRHIRRSHLNEKFEGQPLVASLVEHLNKRSAGVLHTTSLEGIELSSTVAHAPLSGWAAAVGLPVERLERPLRRSLGALSISGMLLASAALTLAFFVGRILDRGFLSLRRSAHNLDRGEVVAMSHSPIGEVNDVVATMSQVSQNLVERTQALAALTNNLESQVSERTKELRAEMRRRKESEAQLHQLQRIEAIGKLTGGIAHDFNNMLAVVMGSLDLMQRRLSQGDTDVEKYIKSAMQGTESAANLTQRLLAFSRQQALRPQAVDCNKLIGGMSEILRRTIPENIAVETVLAGGLWRTYIDVSGLENSILNLAVNARDAMPGGGKLTIETANAHLDDSYAAVHAEVVPGQYVMVAITDTGTGIAEDILESVFEPFFTTKQAGHGTGLGLSQVHGFIKQSGGHIKIYSERDQGTTVRLYLPRLMTDTSARDPAPEPARATPHASDNEAIVIAEDDPSVRQGTVRMLEELGYAVLEAGSGSDALRLLETNPEVALLITDVVMPGMNGRQLADEATRRWPGLHVLYTTGYTRNAIVHHGTLDPGVHLITKPFTLDALARKVAEVLQSRG